MARGFSQIKGVKYDETFAHIAWHTYILSLISTTVEIGWQVHEMDVKTTFLNGFIEEEVYVERPHDFEVLGWEIHVYRLR